MSQVTDEYRTVASGAGRIDRRTHGCLIFEGRDAASFLHALVTNDVKALGMGSGAYAAYLTPQGRMIADMTIHHRRRGLFMDVGSGRAADLAARFDQLIFSEDVRVSDVSATVSHLTVLGEKATAVLNHAFSVVPIAPEVLSVLPILGHVEAGDAMIVRTDEVGLPSFDVFLPASALDLAVLRLDELGAVKMSDALFEALRIEAGRPVFGADMNEDTIPLEAGLLERAINTSKGCYVGQEIIIRILHRGGGRVAKRLARLTFDPVVTDSPPAGAAIVDGDREVGRITSAAMSPSTGHAIALGYVHRDAAEEGKVLDVRTGTWNHTATISGFAS
jgi:tRNA-modifying protein YgfZ